MSEYNKNQLKKLNKSLHNLRAVYQLCLIFVIKIALIKTEEKSNTEQKYSQGEYLRKKLFYIT